MTKIQLNTETYRGFEIKGSFIYKDGKEVFINTWRNDRDTDTAKRLIDASLIKDEEYTNYQLFQAEKYGNILEMPQVAPDGSCELENGSEEMQRFAEWNNEMAERQLEPQY
jgi:hypothetical protein